MNCPKCGSAILHVYETRHYEAETIRRRICENRHKFRTVEVIADVEFKDGEPEITFKVLDRYSLG